MTTFTHPIDALEWALERIKEYHEEGLLAELPEQYEAAQKTIQDNLLEARYHYKSDSDAAQVAAQMPEFLHPTQDGKVITFRGTPRDFHNFGLKTGDQYP